MTDRQAKILVFSAAYGVVLTAWLIIAAVLYVCGPWVEPYVAGYVVDIKKPDQIWRGYLTKKETHREVEVACFRLHALHKLAPAVPHKYAFSVEARLSDEIPVSAYLAGPDRQATNEDLATHQPGTTWDRVYCFEMPGTIADEQPIRVSGHAEHTRLLWTKIDPKTHEATGFRWPFWYSITPVPEFVVAPEECYRKPRPAGAQCDPT